MPRTSFTSSRFIRRLADLAAVEGAEPKQSIAERLGQWLDFNDAIALFSALGGGPAAAGGGMSAGSAGAPAEEFLRVRTALADSIATDGVTTANKARIPLPTPAPGAPVDSAADFLPYLRYYFAHQRDMTASIGRLRTSVRAALAGGSPARQRLAALDAVMDGALGARERSLLATVPMLLERRFEALRSAHLATLADTGADDDPQAWLAVFCRDMQGLLLAELDLRLEPVLGLIEALGNEVTKQQ